MLIWSDCYGYFGWYYRSSDFTVCYLDVAFYVKYLEERAEKGKEELEKTKKELEELKEDVRKNYREKWFRIKKIKNKKWCDPN